ncbi:MAG: hypothetical protein R3288_07595 [Woeseiaceae bacterium]|nr:hypothetical protein [Woeseiaceae bacterium]
MLRFLTSLIAAGALASAPSAAAADRWLEKRKPEELYAYVDAGECPIGFDELTAAVRDRLIRSRIRPLTEWPPGDIALYVTVDCTPLDDDAWVFDMNVMLAKFDRGRGDDVVISFRHEDQFGSYGKGGRKLIVEGFESALEAAFMKYLRANFDLEPGSP